MRIVVPVKHVPDTAAERGFATDHTVDRDGVAGRLSELDEYAVEQALQLAETHPDTHVTYLTMGPPPAAESLRKALAMGGDAAVHVVDDGLHGSDALATSLVLAAALRSTGFDLVVCGVASTDAGMAVVPAMLAERLGVPQLTRAGELSCDGATVRIRRDADTTVEQVEAPLPAVVSVTDQTGEARYPSFRGIMAAKKKPLRTLSLAELDIDPATVGTAAALTTVTAVAAYPPRTAGTLVTDDGTGAAALADFLVAQKFL